MPKRLVELHKDFRVRPHPHLLYGLSLSVRKRRFEVNSITLEDTDGESTDGVICFDTPVVGIELDTLGAVLDLFHCSLETKPWVVFLEELVCFSNESSIVAPLIDDKIALVAEMLEGSIVSCDSTYEATFFWSICRLKVPAPPVNCSHLHIPL